MSLSIFTPVPAGAIEVLNSDNKPHFKTCRSGMTRTYQQLKTGRLVLIGDMFINRLAHAKNENKFQNIAKSIVGGGTTVGAPCVFVADLFEGKKTVIKAMIAKYMIGLEVQLAGSCWTLGELGSSLGSTCSFVLVLPCSCDSIRQVFYQQQLDLRSWVWWLVY